MKTKSFFADSVAAAMWQARRALGEDALLVTSRCATKERRHLGAYEVVFGVRSASEPEAPKDSEEYAGVGAGPVLSFSPAPSRKWSPQLKRLRSKLLDFEMDKSLADALTARVASRLARETLGKDGTMRQRQAWNQGQIAEKIVNEELDGFFPRELELEGPAAGRVFALFGPPGVGKTSAAIRLAVRYGVTYDKRPLLVATTDNRVAGDARLARYAELLGAEYRLADSLQGLESALANIGKDVPVFIDTPGFAPQELESARGLAVFLGQRRDVQRHLVLPATMKLSDLRENVRLFSPFATQRLLFTKLDETSRFGPILSVAAESGIPISFFTNGQQVPGNVSCASSLRLSRRLPDLGREARSLQPRGRKAGRRAGRGAGSRESIRKRRDRRVIQPPIILVPSEPSELRDAS